MLVIFLILMPMVLSASEEACWLGERAVELARLRNEYPPEFFRLQQPKPPRVRGAKLFFYVNSTISNGECYRPLSIEEKVAQQAGKSHADLLKSQLTGYRNNKWAQKIESSKLKNRFGYEPLSQYFSLWRSPAVAVNFKKVMGIRHISWSLQKSTFGNGVESDRGDALRHFVGAFLLSQELGDQKARFILDLHERDVVNMASLMDRYNNNLGLYEALQRRANWTPEQVAFRAIALIETRKLVTLVNENRQPVSLDAYPLFKSWAHELLSYRLQ